MTEILAVFRSRSQAADCNTRLKNFGIPTSLVNTPKEANVGCGLSVKTSSARPHADYLGALFRLLRLLHNAESVRPNLRRPYVSPLPRLIFFAQYAKIGL